ncbi:MAG: lytic transglycosylase domain-containing protein [Rhodospirillaceae bacterium]|jgi:hypothetical protein|nr:lytic transglycosylase domain-containing protein [Rhodospirillaceae bacterium]MBT5878842.1 lytic transglycosylase domain-containing protein [Rhodospirillaceae bacterium]MBT6589270.1 lytic transglycosylase domain-containing protein [Rhodospirillaceae bacterium]
MIHQKMIRRNLMKATVLGLALAATTFFHSADARPANGAFDRNGVKRLIVAEAEATSLPPSLALALAKVESDFQVAALSERGARGVMQIMPRTARDEFGVGEDELWDPRLNIQLGLSFLEQLIDRYGGRWDLALSHYNGGSLHGRGAGAKAHGFTRRYVQSVLKWEKRYAAQAAVWDTPAPPSKESWKPARTVANKVERHPEYLGDASTEMNVEAVAEADWRHLRRLDMVRKARAARRAARAEHTRRRLAQRHLRHTHQHHDHADLDDFSPYRGRRHGGRG